MIPRLSLLVRAGLCFTAATGLLAAEASAALRPQATGSDRASGNLRVLAELEIREGSGGFGGTLLAGDRFGSSIAATGDLDDDGVNDLVVGADGDDDLLSAGAVWFLFMQADGSVRTESKLSATVGGLAGVLSANDEFGSSVAGLGDHDGDGIEDVVVGASARKKQILARLGAIFVLFLRTDGSVRAYQEIGSGLGGFGAALNSGDKFGSSVAQLGDLDGDGAPELAVGAIGDDDGGFDRGAVWILSVNADGTVRSESKISATSGGFGGSLADLDRFGSSLAAPGDLDGDGLTELVVGASGDSAGGAIWILFLNADGSVRTELKITDESDGFPAGTSTLELGSSLGVPGDLDSDLVPDLLAGDGLTDEGVFWTLFLSSDGSVRAAVPIGAGLAGFEGDILIGDHFGSALAPLGDLDADGELDWAVGASHDDDTDAGATWSLEVAFTDLPAGPVDAPPSVTVRNGSGSNPVLYSTTSLPVLGATWTAQVDLSTSGGSGFTVVLGYSAPSAGFFLPAGELLIDPTSAFLLQSFATGIAGTSTHAIDIPLDPLLLGAEVFTQALVVVSNQLTNAIDLELGF